MGPHQSALEEDQFRDTVEFCLNTFREGVKRYKNTLRLGKTPMETILDGKESDSEEENRTTNTYWQNLASDTKPSSNEL